LFQNTEPFFLYQLLKGQDNAHTPLVTHIGDVMVSECCRSGFEHRSN